MKRRRDIATLSLSFLDVISCGFGAIVLLLVLTKSAEPVIFEKSTEALDGRIADLQQQLFELRGETKIFNRELSTKQEQLSREQAKIARLQGDLSNLRGQYAASKQSAEVANLLEEQFASAKQELSEEMKRLLGASYRRKDQTIGGIPVDSEYIIFVIDTSGSMFNYSWPAMLKKISETLDIYPKVKGIQVMNDMGTYMFSRYRRKWIPDTPARRKAIIARLKSWNAFSNSSPVEGITQAIRTFYAPDKKISVYVFGDEFTGESIEAVVETVDRINKVDEHGNRRVRIHAVGFPVQFARVPHLQTTGIRFAVLMRILTHKNGGTFVGLNTISP